MNPSQMENTIPQFETYEEEAGFWDTHDTTEFEDEFEPVQVTFARPVIRRGLIVLLDMQTVEQLRRLASEKHVKPSVLAQTWILDHLRAETAHTP